jgi:hypothetical protein
LYEIRDWWEGFAHRVTKSNCWLTTNSFIPSKNSEEFDHFGTFLIQVRHLEFREKLLKRIYISNPWLEITIFIYTSTKLNKLKNITSVKTFHTRRWQRTGYSIFYRGGGHFSIPPLVKIEFVLDFIEDQGFRRSVFFFFREECNGSRLWFVRWR